MLLPLSIHGHGIKPRGVTPPLRKNKGEIKMKVKTNFMNSNSLDRSIDR